MPNCSAVADSAPGSSWTASCANVVLQERENAVRSGTEPSSNRPALGTMRSPITVVPGHATGVVAATPSSVIAAVAVTTLNVEPGGYRPLSASGPSASAAGFCATASKSPVDAEIATSIACCATGSTASSAAACTARSIPTVTVLPECGGSSTSVRTALPVLSTTTTDQPGTPSNSSAISVRTPVSTCRPDSASGAR